jgi:hypothetical protein
MAERPADLETLEEAAAPGLPSTENLAGLEPATRPADYGALNAVWAALVAGLVAAERRRGRGEKIDGPELVHLGAASFALSKVIAREKIGSWLREPFVEELPGRRKLRGTHLRRAVGELVTCTRCVGAWSSVGVVGLRILSPRTSRVVTAVLATSATNDFLQAGFRALCEASNSLADQSG